MLSGLCGLPSSAALFGISAWRRVPRVLRAERVVDSCRALPNSSLTYSLLESCPLSRRKRADHAAAAAVPSQLLLLVLLLVVVVLPPPPSPSQPPPSPPPP